MKRLIAVFLAAMLAMNMIACDAGELTPEQIEIITKAVDSVNDELDNGDLEERWEEFSENLHPEELELHWDRLSVEDYETLGIDMEQLQQAGLVIDELGINEIDPSAINLSQLRLGDLRGLGQKNLEVLGYGGITLADLEALGILSAIDLSKMDLSTEELIALLSDMSPENLMKIGLNKMDFGDFGANLIMNLYLNGVDLDALGLGDIDLSAIDFAALLDGFDLSSIDLSGIDFSQIDLSDLDLSSLDPAVLDLVLLNLGGLDMSNLDLSALNLDSLNLEGLDLSSLNLDGLDLGELDPAILELVLLNLGGVDLSDIDLEDLNLDALDLSQLDIGSLMANGVDLSVLDPALLEEIDLNDLDLSMLDLDALDMSRIDWSKVDWDQVDLDLGALDLDNIDPSSIDFSALDLSELPLEDLSIEDLEILGIDDVDISALNLGDIDFTKIDPEDLDFSEMTVGDLAAFGITVEDLEEAGLVPEDIAGDITVLFGDYLEDAPEVSVSLSTDDEKAAENLAIELTKLTDDKKAAEDLAVEITKLAEDKKGAEDLAVAITKLAEDKDGAEDLAIEFSKLTDDEIEAMLGLVDPKKDDKKDDKKADDKKDDKKVEEKKDDKKADEKVEEKIEEEPAEEAEATEETEEITEGIVADADGNVTFLPDKKPDLKDDFYSAINYDVAKNAEIPTGYPEWMPFVQNAMDTDAQIEKIVNDAVKEMADANPEDPEYRIGAFYETLLDMDARNEAGVEPIQKWIDAYEKAEDLDDLLEADLAYAEDTMGSNILTFAVNYNPEDSKHYVINIDSMMHGPDKEIMIGEGMDAARDAYLVYLGELFRGAGYGMVDSVMMGAATYALQTDYEEHTLSAQDKIDPSVTTNLFTQKELEKKFKNLPIAELLAAIGLDEEEGYETYQVSDLAAMEYLNSIYNEDSFEMIRANAIESLIQRYSVLLSQDLYDSTNKFTNTVNGITDPMPFEQEAADIVNGCLSADVGMIYADKYCSDETKDEVEEMIDDIMAAYHVLIESNEWMDDQTKDKALEKLDKMQINVAYPDRWYNDAEDAEIKSIADGGSAFENYMSISKATKEAVYQAAKGKVKRAKWDDVTPQTVNACYSSEQNSIYICAAMLQNAFYDPEADYATNLGGIGYVIAHEISHAFDSTGAQYDADGNVADWWTASDWKAFEERADAVKDYYSQYVVIPGTDVCANGDLTITENLADLGALKALETICDGDTKMFEKIAENAARVWAEKINQNALQLTLNSDVHSPAKARVNVPLQMTDLFYDTFDIEEGDGMYVAPDERIGIW